MRRQVPADEDRDVDLGARIPDDRTVIVRDIPRFHANQRIRPTEPKRDETGQAPDNVRPAPINDRAQVVERRLQLPMLVAALLVVPSLLLTGTVAAVLGWGTWLAFLAEAVVMLVVVDDRTGWLREHPLEVAIVLLTPPVLPASLQATRVFRVLRVLRLLRLAALTRRLTSPEGVRDAGVLALVTVLGGGAAYSAAEKAQDLSAWDGVWWAITTVTTVGYGDEYPVTTLGRVIAIGVMLAGIGFIAILTAAAAERFVRHQRAEEDATLVAIRQSLQDISARLESLEPPSPGDREPPLDATKAPRGGAFDE